MTEEPISAEDFLKIVAGDVCPCGHEKEDHGPGAGPLSDDPDAFVEVMGACSNCECKGLLE